MIFNIVNIVLAILWIVVAVCLIILPLHIKHKYAKMSAFIYVYYTRYLVSLIMIMFAIPSIILGMRFLGQNSTDNTDVFYSVLIVSLTIVLYRKIYHLSSFILVTKNKVYLGRYLNKWSLTPLKITPQDFCLNLEQYKNGGIKSAYGFGLPDVNGVLNNVWFNELHRSKLVQLYN